MNDGGGGNNEENDVVVQWQISGVCVEGEEEEECGLIQYKNLDIPEFSSAITESRINREETPLFPDNIAIDSVLRSINTNEQSLTSTVIFEVLNTMKTPTLTLFLGEKLISTEGKNVPYLEYQVLTDQPISNSQAIAEVTINIDGNIFTKTLYKEEQKPLVDFALQN